MNDTIWYKAQRVLRTIVQVILAFLSVWAVIAVIAPQILTELTTILPGPWVAWLAGLVAAVTGIAGALSRIMAIPQVNAWLSRLGLGSAPRSADTVGVTIDPDDPAAHPDTFTSTN